MFKKISLLFLIYITFFISSMYAAELGEYTEIKKIMKNFDSISSAPANLFSVFINESNTELETRYQFIKDLKKNMNNLLSFGDFPYNPTGKVNEEEYKALEKTANENRINISEQFAAIEKGLSYLEDIYTNYQYMTSDDKKARSSTVIKYILGQTVLPEEALPVRVKALSDTDCMSWLDSELQLLAFQFENNDPNNDVDFEDYSKINLTQCLNYLTTGYSMVVSAKQINGDDDTEAFYNKYDIAVQEMIKNHEASIRKLSNTSNRKATLYDIYEDSAFTMSKVISYIFVIVQLLLLLLH
ncbi:hypothetical protein BCR32DRAFT_297932 [Anaeromyces robustus]|uniref:Uncharacterized protein n=1 Tax=Anaeromyces robustus TaxID=1754192 RepID=A0A1Y1VU39_9FUNG|nr:hypothetical protein BCR32DRAFT_297932 [Anaeromyces robustus]|eukprot:ORX64811.1 hypothetical protein BCR32DRAFT_297932 [Anaeromyces robustus]